MVLTLRQKLMVLVFAVFVPLSLAVSYQLVHLFNHLRSESVERAMDEAQFATVRMERFQERLGEQLWTAGTAALVQGMPRDRVPEYFRLMNEHTPGVTYALFDMEGRLISGESTQREPIGPPPQEALSDTVLVPLTSGAQGRRGLLIYVPVRDGRDVVGVGAARVERSALVRALPEQDVHGLVLITDLEGRVVYSGPRTPISDQGAASLPTVQNAVQGANGADDWMELPGFDGKHVGVQLPADELTIGFYTTAAEASQHIGDEAALLTVALIATILLSGEFARRYAQDILRDLAGLSSATRRMAVGDFDVQLPTGSDDEIGRLAQDFSVMRTSLQQAFASEALLAEAAAKLNEATTIDDLGGVALDYTGRLLDVEPIAVTVLDPEGEPRIFGRDGESRDVAYAAERVIAYADLSGGMQLAPLTDDSRGELVASFPLRQASTLLGRIDAVLPSSMLGDAKRSELELISSLAGQTATALANVILYERERLIADTLQDSLLTALPHHPVLQFGLEYRPATIGMRIGGDFYDFVTTPSGIVVIVGDISGKGLVAARQTSISKGALHSFAIDEPSPDTILSRANAAILPQFEIGTFVTAFCALIDTANETISYSTAGHPPPILLHLDKSVEFFQLSGPPLGIAEEARYPLRSIGFEPNESLVIVSDGITEARDGSGRLFGEEAVARVVIDSAGSHAEEIANNIVSAAEKHAAGRLEDDLTVVVVSFGHPWE